MDNRSSKVGSRMEQEQQYSRSSKISGKMQSERPMPRSTDGRSQVLSNKEAAAAHVPSSPNTDQ